MNGINIVNKWKNEREYLARKIFTETYAALVVLMPEDEANELTRTSLDKFLNSIENRIKVSEYKKETGRDRL